MKHTFLLTTVVLIFAGVADAQQAPVALTLDEAIARAAAASHRLGEVRAREQSAQAVIEIRRAADRPTVTVNGGYARTNHVDEFGVPQPNGLLRVIYPDIPDNYFTRASMQWPIYTAGRLDALERAAAAEARAVGAEVAVARADLRLEVTRAYWALVTASESTDVLKLAVERAEAHLRDVRAMFDAGLIPPSDVSLVEAQRSRQRMQLIEAENLRRSTAEDLKRLTGLSTDTDVVPATVKSSAEMTLQSAASPPVSPQEAIALGLEQRAERQALLERVTAAESREQAAAAGRKPTIALTGAVDYANPNPRIFPRTEEWRGSWDVTVNASWPIWDGGRSKAEAAEAAATATSLRERLADVDALIGLDVRQRQFDIESAKAAIAAAEDAERSAEEARRVVGERFQVGVATSTDVLDAQVALLQAQLDRTRSIATLRLAEARLDRAMGR